METFLALLDLCAGNSPVAGEFLAQRPVTRSFDVFFDLRLNKRLSRDGEAGDLRRHGAHYDVIVMILETISSLWLLTAIAYTWPCLLVDKTQFCPKLDFVQPNWLLLNTTKFCWTKWILLHKVNVGDKKWILFEKSEFCWTKLNFDNKIIYVPHSVRITSFSQEKYVRMLLNIHNSLKW